MIFLWEACFFWYNKGIKTKEKKRGFQCKGHSAARAEVYQDPELPEEDCSQEPRPRKKKATHAELFKGLKVHKEVIPLDEEDKVCPVCASPMERIGEEYVRRELVFTPAKCEVYEYYTESYGYLDCKEGKGATEKSVIVKSKVPPALIGKGPTSSSLLHGQAIRSMQTACLSIVRKRTGKSMVPLSAGQPLRTESSTVLGIIPGHCMITFTASFC